MASLSQGRTAAAQCGLFTYKSVLVIFEPPCSNKFINFSYITFTDISDYYCMVYLEMIKSLLHSVNDSNDISHCVQFTLYIFSLSLQ